MTFFFDNHHPPDIITELRLRGFEVVHLRERFSDRGVDDEVWIPIVAENGWALVTGDYHILRRRAEKTVFRRAQLITFFMAKEYNNKRSHVRVRWLCEQWQRIEAAAAAAQPGDCFLVPEKGKLRPYPLPYLDES